MYEPRALREVDLQAAHRRFFADVRVLRALNHLATPGVKGDSVLPTRHASEHTRLACASVREDTLSGEGR
jgi:hypothetical protein